jgi:hypothetical protein
MSHFSNPPAGPPVYTGSMLSRILTLTLAGAALTAAADLSSLAWLTGRWVEEDKGTVSEEIWSPPAGDSMMGMWRLVAGGKTRIFEMNAIVATGDEIALSLRHFDRTLGIRASEKEAPVRLTLRGSTAREAAFEGVENGVAVRLTYRRPTDTELHVTLDKDGKKQEFHFRRTAQ